ncbi:unnamed protein product [Arabidopsis halleri]
MHQGFTGKSPIRVLLSRIITYDCKFFIPRKKNQ